MLHEWVFEGVEVIEGPWRVAGPVKEDTLGAHDVGMRWCGQTRHLSGGNDRRADRGGGESGTHPNMEETDDMGV